MRRGAKLGAALAGTLFLVGGGVVWYLGPIAPIATGYAAKTVCSGAIVAGRPVADVEGDLPPNPLVPFLRTQVQEDRVTTTLLGAWGSTAWATNHGCTLADTFPQPAERWEPAGPELSRAWPLGDLVESADLSPGVLEAVQAAFVEDDPEGLLKNTRAVVVVQGGQVVAEQYAEGFDADTRLLGWSMSKSIANAMVGRLAGRGLVELDRPLPWIPPDWAADARATITMRHLLQMRSGLAFEEVYDPGTDATQMLFTPQDTGQFAARKPLTHEVGSFWHYSSGTSNIVCDVLHEVSTLGPQMAQDLVFGPLGMRSAVLEADAAGDLVCSSFTYATARDWAKFGQWFLQDGLWDGQRLLPEDWVEFSTTPVDGTDNEPENPYGAHWWLNADADGNRRMPSVPADAYWASGNEGQHVVVIPSQELVVVRLGLSQDFSGIDWGLEALLAGIIGA